MLIGNEMGPTRQVGDTMDFDQMYNARVLDKRTFNSRLDFARS